MEDGRFPKFLIILESSSLDISLEFDYPRLPTTGSKDIKTSENLKENNFKSTNLFF